MGQAFPFQQGLDLRPGAGKKGTDDVFPPDRNSAQPPQTGSPEQMEQQRFSVVVGVVGGGQLAGRGEPQKVVTQDPGGLLQAFTGFRSPPGGVSASQTEGNFPGGAERPAEFRVPIRFLAPEPMVKMGGPEADFQLRRQRPQNPKQGHGVGTAGQGDGHVVPGGEQSIVLKKAEDLIFHRILNSQFIISQL